MAFQKIPYEPGNNLTAEQMNNIQDAILNNITNINNINNKIGDIEISLNAILDIQKNLIGGNPA